MKRPINVRPKSSASTQANHHDVKSSPIGPTLENNFCGLYVQSVRSAKNLFERDHRQCRKPGQLTLEYL